MPIEPGKMAAFVNEGSPPPEGEAEGEETNPGEGGVEKFAALIPMLEEFAEDVVELSDEMDVDVLLDETAEISPEDEMILKEGVATLDRRLKKELESCCGGMTMEEATTLAEHLADEGIIDDSERIGGWIYRVGVMYGGKSSHEEDEEEGMGAEAPPPPEE